MVDKLPDYSVLRLDLSQVTPEMFAAALPKLDLQQLDIVLDAVRKATQSNLDAQQKAATIALALQQALQLAGFVMAITPK